MTINDREKAIILSNFFSSAYTKPEWTWILDEDETPRIRKELKLEITKEAIRQKLTKIKSNKSPGPDTMHPRVVKEMVDVLVSQFLSNIALNQAWKNTDGVETSKRECYLQKQR